MAPPSWGDGQLPSQHAPSQWTDRLSAVHSVGEHFEELDSECVIRNVATMQLLSAAFKCSRNLIELMTFKNGFTVEDC